MLQAVAVILLLFGGPVAYQFAVYHFGDGSKTNWWNAKQGNTRQAPDAGTTDDGIIQVYAARTVRWRGVLGVHTWIATKKTGEDYYTRMEVMGYALRWGRHSVQIRRGQPDRYWYGNRPELLREIRGGDEVDGLIDRLRYASENYQYDGRYNIWPGPNSNTFLAYLGRRVPELNLELPSNAIGKDYLPGGSVLAATPSGRGFQFSLGGALGFMLGLEEGVEINIAGLTAGVDFSPPAIKLPAVGRIGFSDFERKLLN